jgi:hypothetical protein
VHHQGEVMPKVSSKVAFAPAGGIQTFAPGVVWGTESKSMANGIIVLMSMPISDFSQIILRTILFRNNYHVWINTTVMLIYLPIFHQYHEICGMGNAAPCWRIASG